MGKGLMAKLIVMAIGVLLVFGMALSTSAAEKALPDQAVFDEFKALIPADRIVKTDKVYKVWQDIMAGKSKAVILDIRSHPEFNCGHIEGANHITGAHVYHVLKEFPDKNTEIYVYCRTKHRATYFVGILYKYGYKNAYLVEDGIVGWIKAGYPLVNEFMGEFKVTRYEKQLKEKYIYREFR